MYVRSKVVLITCAVLIAAFVVSEELWNNFEEVTKVGDILSFSEEDPDASQKRVTYQPPSIGVFVGRYKMSLNGSVSEGTSRALINTLPSASTGRVSTMHISLLGSRVRMAHFWPGTQSEDRELQLRSLDLAPESGPTVVIGRMVLPGSTARPLLPGYAEAQEEAGTRDVSCRLDGLLKRKPPAVSGDSQDLQEQPTPTPAPGLQAFDTELKSFDCGLSVDVDFRKVDLDHVGTKVVKYGVWINMLTILQLRTFLGQMRHTEEGHGSVSKLSVVAIAMQALMDAYDSFLHLSISTPVQVLNTYNFAVVSMLKFSLFALVEVRYLLLIWRQRHLHMFSEGWDTIRQELSRVYAQFYGALIGGLVLIFIAADYLDFLTFAMQAYWLPQIVHDVRHGSKNSLTPSFIVIIAVTRTLQFLYLWGCPAGIFDGELYPKLPGSPSLELCAAAVLLQVLQVVVMMSQRYLGPRWFVPWLCLPHVYNYRRSASESTPVGSECVICMLEISPEDGLRRVITPCDHRFHEACLTRWMDVKMECPTCRRALPPIH